MRMDGAFVALYGRFRYKTRREIARAAEAAGARTSSDLVRQTTLFVVGAGAVNHIATGHLPARLAAAHARGVPVMGEGRFVLALAGQGEPDPTFPLDKVGQRPDHLVEVLSAFDLIYVKSGHCRFADVGAIRSAITLLAEGHALRDVVAILAEHRRAPAGRHSLTVADDGTPLLRWDDGVTTLDGQGMLELEDDISVEERFEAAMEAEAEGDFDLAERLYDACARVDRRDPIAPFNLGNVLVQLGRPKEAAIAYRQAIARDTDFAEAHYNLARLAESVGDETGAETHLRRALAIDGDYADAVFNLAQLRLAKGDRAEARRLFERFIAIGAPPYWLRKARAALQLIAADG